MNALNTGVVNYSAVSKRIFSTSPWILRWFGAPFALDIGTTIEDASINTQARMKLMSRSYWNIAGYVHGNIACLHFCNGLI